MDLLQPTKRGTKGFGSTGLSKIGKQSRTGARLLSQDQEEKPRLKGQLVLAQNDPSKEDYLSQNMPEPISKQFYTGVSMLIQHAKTYAPKKPPLSTREEKIHIREISAKAFGKCHCKGEVTGVLWGTYVNQELKIAVTNDSTELAIKNKQKQREKEINEIIPKEYWEYKDVVLKEEATELPPHRQGVDLEINLAEGATLGIKKIYPLGAQELEELHTYIKQNERRDWIQESFVEGWFPIMFVKKKDCKLRLCMGYWALNNVTKKDRYPLPVIREPLDRLQDAKYFTKLDIKDAYHNIRIREGDELKTTFTSKLGTYEYRVMPFGLCNPPATFARWINRTFH